MRRLRRAWCRLQCLLTGHPGGVAIAGRYECFRCSTRNDLTGRGTA